MSSINKNLDRTAHVVNLNAVQPIGPAAPTQAPAQVTGTESAKPKVNLFDSSTYTSQAPVALADGSVITLPALSPEEASKAQALFANVAPEHQGAVNAAAADFGRALLGGSSLGGAKMASSSNAQAYTLNQASPDVAQAAARAQSTYKSSVSGTFGTYGNNSGATNYDDTVQATAYMGVLGLQGELGTYAQNMQNTQAQQNVLRTDQSELTTAIAGWGDDPAATQSFTWHEVDKDGSVVTKNGELTKAQAQAALGNVQSALSSFTDQTQLQAIQLQTMAQNYQNGINTISNLMKAAYDTTKNTLGNIHY